MPAWPHRQLDEELGSTGEKPGSADDDGDYFDIPPKNAPIERLRRWRQAAFVLNASRRFRYTLDLKREQEEEEIRKRIRAHAAIIRAAFLFQEAGQKATSGTSVPALALPSGGFGIGEEQLTKLTRDHDFSSLQEYGGVKGLADLLKTNLGKGIRDDEEEIVERKNVFGANTYPQKKGKSFWVKGLADLLKTNLGKGIRDDEEEIVERKNVFGANTYPQKKGKSFWAFLWEASQDLTHIILMVAAVLLLVLGIRTEGIKETWYDGGSIALAVMLLTVVTASSDYRQDLLFQNLNEEKRNIQLEVIRGGRRIKVSIFDLVVGDAVPLKIGDQVPADGILISGHSLAIDESSMTGESEIVQKNKKSPFLMSGCKVADGYGNMLVTAVGLNTEWGLLMASISGDTVEETPLQVRLNGVATFIGIVGLTVAAAVLVVLLARYFTGHTQNPDGSVQFIKGQTDTKTAINGAIKILTVAVCGNNSVVAVPEGLPLAVTVTLAYFMQKMTADKALVRRLSACETMGTATTICSDKTGTLTLSQMTVVEAYVGGSKIVPPDSAKSLSSTVCSFLIEGIAQNTTGSVFETENGAHIEISGSPTEKAILSWGVKLGMRFDDARSKSSIIHAFPFNSEKKRSGMAIQSGDEVHVHWKGAAEIVLAACTSWLDEAGSGKSLAPDKVNEFKRQIEDMAAASLRCIAFAYRPYEKESVPKEDQIASWQLPEDDLILLAIVGIKDPCRPGVKEVVDSCAGAGVKVRMVTGDNLRTAKAIALECGILKDPNACEPVLIEGKIFRDKSDLERDAIAEKITVMGRSSPSDKLLLVQALKRKGHVVAVTGDGTNDAPALHEANIGLSMGIQGTEVAKQNSDIIILDDNFASIVKVISWGRSVYANIQKFTQFQLTINVAALIINVVAAVSSGNVPLNAVELLWVNLIMDTLGALALATERPTRRVMDRAPVGRREPLVTNVMWRNLIIQAVYQVTVLLALNFGGRSLLRLKNENEAHADIVKNTFIFNTFVLCQVFNMFNSRKPDELNIFSGITKDHLFMGIIGITVLLQALIIEFLGKFTSTVRLNWKLWLVSIAIAFVSWPLALVGKLIPVPSTPFRKYFERCFACNKGKRWPLFGCSATREWISSVAWS